MQADLATPVSASALPQFLRGIGKRGYVLAEAQCGESARAQLALRATIDGFRDAAARLPLAQWPEQFWQRLLAQSALRTPSPVRDNADPLTLLSAGPRAALLLRLVAGLDNTHGAAVLRVSPAAYRQALQRALQVLHGQGIGEVALRGLRERLQLRVKGLPEQFLQMPANDLSPQVAARHAALAPIGRARGTSLRWLRPALWVALCIVTLLFAVTFLHRPQRPSGVLESERLPEQPVAARLSWFAAALASPDFALLNDPGGERDARDLALLSWFDAAPAAPQSSDGAPVTLPESSTPETSAPDTDQVEGGRPGAP